MSEQVNNYFSALKDKSVTVVGIGVSHTPLIRLLVRKGARVTACDKRTANDLGDLYNELTSLGVDLHLGPDYLKDLPGELIFKTPGMRFDIPELLAAADRGAVVTSEMEVFFSLCPCPIIAITGSDGKSTTTTLVAEMMKAAGYVTHLGGNIGRPLLPDVEQIAPTDRVVVELSSFQLHTMTASAPRAIVTNVSPNHLDVHKSMEEYIEAKANIFIHQKPQDLLVLNAEDETAKQYAKAAKGEIHWFSGKNKVENGAYFTDGALWLVRNGVSEKLIDRKDLRLRADVNVENFLAAASITDGIVPVDAMRRVAHEFPGLEHRLEFVRELDGVSYYNDSIASSPARTMRGCLAAFDEPLILIAGGYDKRIPFDELGVAIRDRVKALVLLGVTSDKIEQALLNACGGVATLPILRADSMADAVSKARSLGKPGDVVALSPACASFDLYKNFELRGRDFKRCVNEL